MHLSFFVEKLDAFSCYRGGVYICRQEIRILPLIQLVVKFGCTGKLIVASKTRLWLENKGNNDLRNRLYYEGKKGYKTDKLYLIGKDLNNEGFISTAPKDKCFRGNYKEIIKKIGSS